MSRFRAALLFAAVCVSLPACATRYHLADGNKIVRLSDPEISPDGKTIAIVVGHANLDDDRTDSSILLVDIASHTTRVLTRRAHAGFPRWSPDGRTLAFLADDDKHHLQVWTLSTGEAGDSEQLTHSPTSIEQFAWRPDGHALAFVAEDDTPERKGRDKFMDAVEIGNNDFLAHEKQMPAHLWLLELPASADAKPQPRRLTEGSWSLIISLPPGPPASPIQWTPDGKSILFAKVPTPLSGDGEMSSIQILDVASGHYKPLTGAPSLEAAPVISPDGSTVAYLRNRDGKSWNVNDVLLAPAAGGPGREITHGIDRNLARAFWMPDGKTLLVGGNTETTSGLWLLPAAGTTPAQRLNTGDIAVTEPFWVDASVGPHGEIAFTGTRPSSPPELYIMDADHGAPVQLSHLNAEVASREVARQETLTWPSLKGGPLSDGVLTYPIGYQPGKKYPLVLYIHGGPTSASKQTWSTFSQLFAAQGWMVFEPNYRGSDNLGNTYQAAIYNDAGAGPGDDVMAGLAVLRKRPDVDSSNLALAGWSYGGYMTSWLLGHSTIWKAAVDGAAVTNLLDQYNLSDGNVSEADNLGGSPYTSADRMKQYIAQSPITYAANIRTPTLVMCDVGDYRVPITQSYALFHALRDNNVVTQFIAFPVGGHSPGDPIRREDVQRRYIEWLGHYLPTDPGAEAAPRAAQ